MCGKSTRSHDEPNSPNAIKKRALRYDFSNYREHCNADDGECAGEIQQRILGCAEAEVEEQHPQSGVIKLRIKKRVERNDAPPVAVDGIAGIGGHVYPLAVVFLLRFVRRSFLSSQAQ
jgi:hypothetical protein